MTVEQEKPKLQPFGGKYIYEVFTEQGLQTYPITLCFPRFETLAEFGATVSICPKRGTKICKSRSVENKIAHRQVSPAILGLLDDTLSFKMSG
jgi:hypothetical protein